MDGIHTSGQIKEMLWMEKYAAEIRRKVDFAHDYNTLRLIGKAVGHCPSLDDIEIPQEG
jgi:hypothetical protein